MSHESEYLQIAERAARAAGAILFEGAGLRVVNFQDAKDVKLKADVESEALIRELLSQETGLPIVGEEEGGDESLPGKDELYWVVDPLDGTYNYLRSVPCCCVSIGLMRGLEPVLGVIYDFNTDEMFSGSAPGSLTCNGEPVEPWWPESIEHAVLVTGFPSGRDYSTEALAETFRDIQRFQKVRMIGSAAIALAYVAVGRFDAYREESIRLWDIAGGMALAVAAGAKFTITPSNNGKAFAYDIWVTGRPEWQPAR
ncbi:MAG: inositol monophosphatase family protein [Verrucomicrobiota bacterium]